MEKKSPMQSRSHQDSEVFVEKWFCLGLLSYSILYHILHFSVYKTFFTVITSRSLSKKSNLYGSLLYTLVIFWIFLPPLRSFRNIYTQKAWKKDTMATTLILAFDNNGNQNWEKLFSYCLVLFPITNHYRDLHGISGNKVNALTWHVITRSPANGMTCSYADEWIFVNS